MPPEIAEEIAPKNILMIGPTGVGKTEIARRLARLAQSPFIKVEASKFTEVGYVGRDVESMVRDLVELAVDMVKEERLAEVRGKARQAAEERVLDLLLPPLPPAGEYDEQAATIREQAQRTRETAEQCSRTAGSQRSSGRAGEELSVVRDPRGLAVGNRHQREGHAPVLPGSPEESPSPHSERHRADA